MTLACDDNLARGDIAVSVVVPVFNSATLDELVSGIETAAAGLVSDAYEIILVDDASTEAATWTTVERLACAHRHVRGIQLTRNRGQQVATLCGLAAARGRWVVTMDDDLQHDPADMAVLWKHRDHDIVVGQFAARRDSMWRRFLSAVKGWFDRRILRLPAGVRLSSYRLLSRTVVDGVLAISTPRPFVPALLLHVSRRIAGAELTHRPRRVGRSGYTLGSLGSVFGDLLISNSSFLLRLVAQVGVLCAALSFAAAIWLTYLRLARDITVAGWTSLLVVMLLLGGITLFSIGVMGDYLIRIIETGERRPAYYVRRRTDD